MNYDWESYETDLVTEAVLNSYEALEIEPTIVAAAAATAISGVGIYRLTRIDKDVVGKSSETSFDDINDKLEE